MSWSSGLQLRIIDGQKERRDRVIRLDGKELALGRASQGQRPEAGELLFKEPTVSRVHATLTWKPLKGGFQLVHKSKTNPTLVNGKPTKKILLAPGDRVQMGLLILEIEEVPGGRSSATIDKGNRASMREPIREALSKVEREHEEDQRRTKAEREEKQRQREILASPDAAASGSASPKRASSRLDEALRSAPYDPQEESRKRRKQSSFGWQPPEEREEETDYGWGNSPGRVPAASKEEYDWKAPSAVPASPRDDRPAPSSPTRREEPVDVAYDSPPPPRRTIPISALEEQKPPAPIEHGVKGAVYEIVVSKGPDRGKSFPLEHMVMVLGQRQGDGDDRDGQGVLLNDATLPSEIGMFVWQGREGAYGLLASENSMQIMEVERIDHGQRRRIRVDSQSSLLLRVADEIQVGLTTLRVQKIGEPLPELVLQRPPINAPAPVSPSRPGVEPAPPRPVPEPSGFSGTKTIPESSPGRPTPLRGKDPIGFGAPAPPARPQPPQPPPRPQAPEPLRPQNPPSPPPRPVPTPQEHEEEPEVPLWAQGTLVPGQGQNQSAPAPTGRGSGPAPAKTKSSEGELLEWGSRPEVDFLLEFTAGPLRGCQISLSRSEIERNKRFNAGCPGGRHNEIALDAPDAGTEAFHLLTEDGRFSLCNESPSGTLIVNRSPLKTGDRVVLMTGDVITLGSTKLRFLERDVVRTLSQYGLLAESGVTADQDRIFPLNRQRLLVGRGKACDVRLSDLEVSRVHLGLAYSEGTFSVQHRSETNPTFLNGLSLLPGTVRKIKEGDRIRLSSLTVLRLVRR